MTIGGEGTGIWGVGEGLQPNDWQLTGLDKNDLHCAADLCNGLLGKQFLLSSKPGKARHTGGSPVKKL